jgi:tetratricopeptide (TPR) repeat protein
VRPEFQFERGVELTYEFDSAIYQSLNLSGREIRDEARMRGSIRQVAAGAGAGKGGALVGQAGTAVLEVTSGIEKVDRASRNQSWLSVFRMDGSGKSVRREERRRSFSQRLLRRTMTQVSENAQFCAEFPPRQVETGSQWTGTVLLPLPGMRLPGKGVSRITATGEENGNPYCVIRTDLTSEGGQFYTGWMPDIWLPEMEVSGTSEGRFDLRRGIWLHVHLDLVAAFAGQGFGGQMVVESTMRLKSASPIPADGAEAWTQRIQAMDAALACIYEGEPKRSEKLIEQLRDREKEAAIRAGMESVLVLLRQVQDYDATACPPVDGEMAGAPQSSPLRDADRAAQEGDWKLAVSRYEAIAEWYAGRPTALDALSAAADLCEEKGEDREKAAELNRKVLRLLQEQLAATGGTGSSCILFYRLAGAYARTGDLPKAAEAYEQFLGVRAGIPASMRMLAHYRLAAVLETLGQRERAVDAYRRMAGAEAEDEYSGKLKEKARERIQALGAGKKE